MSITFFRKTEKNWTL